MLQLYVLIQDTRVCSSVGASGTNLRDCILNTESEATSKYEVLCSDAQLNETNSIDAIPTLFLQVSIRSKQTSMSFPGGKAPHKPASNIVEAPPPASVEIPPWPLPMQSRGSAASESTPSQSHSDTLTTIGTSITDTSVHPGVVPRHQNCSSDATVDTAIIPGSMNQVYTASCT